MGRPVLTTARRRPLPGRCVAERNSSSRLPRGRGDTSFALGRIDRRSSPAHATRWSCESTILDGEPATTSCRGASPTGGITAASWETCTEATPALERGTLTRRTAPSTTTSRSCSTIEVCGRAGSRVDRRSLFPPRRHAGEPDQSRRLRASFADPPRSDQHIDVGSLGPDAVIKVDAPFAIRGPDLWRPGSPSLYVLRVDVNDGLEAVDQLYTSLAAPVRRRHRAANPAQLPACRVQWRRARGAFQPQHQGPPAGAQLTSAGDIDALLRRVQSMRTWCEPIITHPTRCFQSPQID